MSKYDLNSQKDNEKEYNASKRSWSRSRQTLSGIMKKHIYKKISEDNPYLPLPRVAMEKAALRYVQHGSSKIDDAVKESSLRQHMYYSYRKEYKRLTEGLNSIEQKVLLMHSKRAEKTKRTLVAFAQMVWINDEYKITNKKINGITKDLLFALKIYNKKAQ